MKNHSVTRTHIVPPLATENGVDIRNDTMGDVVVVSLDTDTWAPRVCQHLQRMAESPLILRPPDACGKSFVTLRAMSQRDAEDAVRWHQDVRHCMAAARLAYAHKWLEAEDVQAMMPATVFLVGGLALLRQLAHGWQHQAPGEPLRLDMPSFAGASAHSLEQLQSAHDDASYWVCDGMDRAKRLTHEVEQRLVAWHHDRPASSIDAPTAIGERVCQAIIVAVGANQQALFGISRVMWLDLLTVLGLSPA